MESVRPLSGCQPLSVEQVEVCSLSPEGEEQRVQAMLLGGTLIQLRVLYKAGMTERHDTIAAQISKKLGVKPKKENITSDRDRRLHHNRSTFRRGNQIAVLLSSDSSRVAAAYGVKWDKDNNFEFLVADEPRWQKVLKALDERKREQQREREEAEAPKLDF